jgi:hypothetical protein
MAQTLSWPGISKVIHRPRLGESANQALLITNAVPPLRPGAPERLQAQLCVLRVRLAALLALGDHSSVRPMLAAFAALYRRVLVAQILAL